MVPLKTILIKTTFSSLILPNQPPILPWTHKSCSFLWVICFSCLLRWTPPPPPIHMVTTSCPSKFYSSITFSNSSTLLYLKWQRGPHIICSIPVTRLSFPHIIYYFLIWNIIDLFICLLLISAHPSQWVCTRKQRCLFHSPMLLVSRQGISTLHFFCKRPNNKYIGFEVSASTKLRHCSLKAAIDNM